MEDNSDFFSKPFLSYHDNFEVTKLIYTSDSGVTEIYQARKSLKRFAIKALKKEFRDDPVYVSILRKEFEIGFQLDHPLIVHTYGFENIPELGYCIILEWIDGINLKDCLSKNILTHDDSVRIASDLCDALAYLHDNMIVHQDLKPSNVMITSDNHLLKIIDLGFADSPSFAAIKQSGGTKDYAAPEQLTLTSEEKSHISDIYSLGKIFSQLPFRFSKSLDKLISAMLATNPIDRPQSCKEIKEQLHKVAAPKLGKGDRISLVVFYTIGVIILISVAFYFFFINSHNNVTKSHGVHKELETSPNTNKPKLEKNKVKIERNIPSTSSTKGEAQSPKIYKSEKIETDHPAKTDFEDTQQDNHSGKQPVHWMVLLAGQETMRIGKKYMMNGDVDWERKTRADVTEWVESHTEGENELRNQCLNCLEEAILRLKMN